MSQHTVYVIDDEPDLVDLLTDVVEMAGMNAQGFTRANYFFEQGDIIRDDSVLVLDLHMPEMDGIEVMRNLVQLPHPPLLILISGHDSSVLHAAEKLGTAHNLEIIGTLSKPVDLGAFQRLLEQYAGSGNSRLQISKDTSEHTFSVDELRNAIQQKQLVVHYQPQFYISSGAISSVEALVRWQHPELGLVYPDRFISLVESNGLMGAMTRYMIDGVVRQKQQWQESGLDLLVSVNISAMDITSLVLPEQLADLLSDNKLDPTRLTLEVTESVLMGELVTSLDILTRLRLKGINLSIDDFGTGYSSLSQLHRVPFTELKIDRSFVANMVDDSEARAIVKTCIILGHELNMQVVAEGVESEEHLNILRELECDIAQGYYFSKPVPAEKITEMAKQRIH